MNRDQEWWDRYYLGMAEYVASASKDPSTKVGSVLVNPLTKGIVSVGYNGFPRKIKDLEERYNNREQKYLMVVHSEENSIIFAGIRARGSILYVWPSFMLPPICSRCCASAIQAGISEIVGYLVDEDKLDERQLRWKDSILLSRQMCDEAGIKYRGVKC